MDYYFVHIFMADCSLICVQSHEVVGCVEALPTVFHLLYNSPAGSSVGTSGNSGSASPGTAGRDCWK